MSEIQELKESVNEYKSMTEILTVQLDQREQDIQILDTRLKKQALMSAELETVQATIAEQLVTIEQLEQLVAEDNQLIEQLNSEKSKLSQKLSIMQQMKVEYDSQSTKFEKLEAKLRVLEEAQGVQSLGNVGSSSKDIEDMEAEIQRLSAELDGCRRKNEGLLLELDRMGALEMKQQALLDENKYLTEQLENSASIDTESYIVRIQQLEESLTAFAAQKEQLLVQIQSFHDMEEDYKDELALRKDLEDKLAQVDSEMDFMQSEYDLQMQKIHTLESQLAERGNGDYGTSNRQSTLSDLTDKSNDPSPFQTGNLLSKSQEDLTALVSQLDAAEMEIEELRTKLAEQSINSSTLERVDTAVSPIKTDEDEKIENDFFKISLHEKNLHDKQEEIQMLLAEVDQLEERLLMVSEEKHDLEKQSRKVLSEMAEKHRLELETKIKYITELEEQLAALSATKTHAGTDRIQAMQQEIEDLKHQVAKSSDNHSSAPESPGLLHELEVLQSLIGEKEETIAFLRDELEVKGRQVEVESMEVSSKLAKSEKYLQEKELLIQNLQATINSANMQPDSQLRIQEGGNRTAHEEVLEKEISKLTSELELYKQRNADALSQVSTLQESILDLKDKLDYHTEIAEDALKQLDQYENEILELRQSQKGVALPSAASPQLKDLQETLKARDAELVSIKDRLSSTSKDAQDEIQDLERTNEQLLDKIAALSQKIAQQDNNRMSINPNMLAQKALIDAKAEVDLVKNQLNEAIQKINTFQNEKAELLDELDDLRDHNMILISQLNAMKQ